MHTLHPEQKIIQLPYLITKMFNYGWNKPKATNGAVSKSISPISVSAVNGERKGKAKAYCLSSGAN